MNPAAARRRKGFLGLLLWAGCGLTAGRCLAGAGKDGFQFLDETMGARASSLGGATTAPGDEADGAFYNPAAAAEARQAQMALTYAQGLAGVSRGSAAGLYPLPSGTVSAGLRTLDSGAIPGYDGGDVRTGDISAKDTALTLGYGRLSGPWGAWGLSMTQLSESLAGYSARATALNAGVLVRPPRTPLRFAVALRNLGGKASFRDEKESLPRSWDAGVSYQGFSEALMTSLELHEPAAGGGTVRGGVELWLYKTLALRAGFSSGRAAGNGLTFGTGFKFGQVAMDYAFVTRGSGFDNEQRVGIRYFFGGPADRAYEEGLQLSREGKPAEAILKYEEALDADPRHPGAVRALREAAKSLEREMREEKDEAPESRP